MATSFSGQDGMTVYTSTVLASGLRLYAATGLRPNRYWTPTAMLAKAQELTGQKFRRGQYEAAAQALQDLADQLRPKAIANGEIS